MITPASVRNRPLYSTVYGQKLSSPVGIGVCVLGFGCFELSDKEKR